MSINIVLEKGKYEYHFTDEGGQTVFRHGELWRNVTGDNFTLAMAQRLTELEEVVRKAHEILLHEMDNGRTPVMLQGVGLGYFEDIINEVNI